MRKIFLDETLIVKDWIDDMETFGKLILKFIEQEWRCRFKMLNETDLLGVPHILKDGQIALYILDEDNFKTDELAFCEIKNLKSIETIENEFLKYR